MSKKPKCWAVALYSLMICFIVFFFFFCMGVLLSAEKRNGRQRAVILDWQLCGRLEDRHDLAADESDQFWASHLRRSSYTGRALLFMDDQVGKPWRRHRIEMGASRCCPQFANVSPTLPHLPSHASSQVTIKKSHSLSLPTHSPSILLLFLSLSLSLFCLFASLVSMHVIGYDISSAMNDSFDFTIHKNKTKKHSQAKGFVHLFSLVVVVVHT